MCMWIGIFGHTRDWGNYKFYYCNTVCCIKNVGPEKWGEDVLQHCAQGRWTMPIYENHVTKNNEPNDI